MALTKVSGEVITRPLVLTGNASVSGIMTVGTGSTTTTIDGSQDFPTIRPTLDLNFAATKTLDRRITFTRDSIGTYTDEFGIIQTVPNNVPRFDHDPVTGESLGLLVEESRTNLHLHSENLSSWSVETGGSVGVNTTSTVAPDGNQTADSLFGTLNGSSAYTIISLSNATTYTFSVFLKYLTGNENIRIEIGDAPFARSSTTFNTVTGVLVSNTGGTATVNEVKSYGNGWYRYSITRTTTSAGGGFMDINHVSTTSSSVAVWGAQVESGSFATSYIPTTTAAVTRRADFAKITGTNFTGFYNSSEGTLFAESSFADLTTENQATVQLWYSSTEHIGMGYRWGGSGSATYGFYIRNTADQLYRAPSGVTSNTFVKTSLAYKSNDGASSFNGETAVFDDSINLPTASTEMTIGYGNQTSSYRMKQGHIKQLTYYNKRLTNSQLQSLTRQ